MTRNWLPNETWGILRIWVTREIHNLFYFFVFFSHPSRNLPLFEQLVANVRYRPEVEFGNLGLEGRLSTLESVIYACPGCTAAPKLRLCG